MRTTFVERHLFNGDLCSHDTSFIQNRKGWAESKLGEIQREREIECVKWSVATKGLQRGL
jgi:hypothetical protein